MAANDLSFIMCFIKKGVKNYGDQSKTIKISNQKTQIKGEQDMGKIKLNNNQELEIIADGIQQAGNYLTLQLVPGEKTIIDYDEIFSQEANTKKIWVIDYTGELFKQYSGFTKLQSIEKQYDAVVFYTEDADKNRVPVTGTAIRVTLAHPDQTEQRITSLEETVDALTMEILGM